MDGQPAGRSGSLSYNVEGQLRLLRPTKPVSIVVDEKALVEGCQAGQRTAQEGLYRLYRARVWNVVVRISGEQDAEELCQEVFLKIFRNIARFRGESAIGTWIYRLAVNAALTHVSRRPRERPLDEAGWEEPAAPHLARDPRLRERIERALGAMPAGYRAVLVLHDVEGLSHEEISEILGCRVGTSKSQLHKARQKMRELLGPALSREAQS
jgi:RNA polymerase sigma-70 factor (ECF subfamily)